jgi:hypothetical protein
MDEPLNADELAAVQARADAATPGPWNSLFRSKGISIESIDGSRQVALVEPTFGAGNMDTNAVFIAHAREDVPRLLATIAAMREIVRAVAGLTLWSDLPVMDARALLGMVEPAQTDEAGQ